MSETSKALDKLDHNIGWHFGFDIKHRGKYEVFWELSRDIREALKKDQLNKGDAFQFIINHMKDDHGLEIALQYTPMVSYALRVLDRGGYKIIKTD